MTARFPLAIAALVAVSACMSAPEPPVPFDAVPEQEAIPDVVMSRVPASVPREDVRVRGGCWYFILSGTEFPVELAPGQPYCENRPTSA